MAEHDGTRQSTNGILPGLPILAEIERLPTISPVVAEVLRLTSSDMAHAADVATAISRDPALTARVLRLVNSAYFGFSTSVATVYHAVIILGFEAVRSLTVAVAAVDAASHARKEIGVSLEDYWYHAAAVASSSRDVARSALPCSWGEAFTAGLLHDIGHLILASCVPQAYREVMAATQGRGRPIAKVEQEILGADHTEIGALVARRWNLPELLVSAIRHHHDPGLAEDYREVVAAVHVANVVAHTTGAPGLDASYTPVVSQDAWQILGVHRTGAGPHETARFASYLAHQAASVRSLASALSAA